MQVVHEAGPVLVAGLTGAEVTKVALPPLIVSRTDVPRINIPLQLFGVARSLVHCFRSCCLVWLGISIAWGVFCCASLLAFVLIANGVYIGIGHFLAEGADPWVMMANGSPRWVLVLFGAVAFPLGLYLWHRQGPHFGLGDAKGKVDTRAVFISGGVIPGPYRS